MTTKQAKAERRRWPGRRGLWSCWDCTPFQGGYILREGVGGVRLPDGGLLCLQSGRVVYHA